MPENTNTQPAHRQPWRHLISPIAILIAMEATLFLAAAVLPLYGLWFHTALINQLADWTLFPVRLLFPGWQLTSTLFTMQKADPPSLVLSWQATALLFIVFTLFILCYLLALRYLPRRIGPRFIIVSTLLIGLTCVLLPTVSSPDVYSYIIYARMAVIYHLNPLTALPSAIPHDIAYAHIYWTDQPSAYGPTWAIITVVLQWLTGFFGTDNLAAMVLSLRLLGLVAHLGSTLLIWSSGAYLQRLSGVQRPHIRILATLAFAWNPLLLFEACVNAHNDTIMLFLILLALWLLLIAWTRAVSNSPEGQFMPALSQRFLLTIAIILAIATCLKPNAALIIPGLILLLWNCPNRLPAIATTLIGYLGTIILLFAPFWDNGHLLNLLRVNPGTSRAENTLSEFLSHLLASLAHLFGAGDISSQTESLARLFSLALFVAGYGWLCWRALAIRPLNTPIALIRWLTLAWLLYSIFGAPWFWPWYIVTFFGLYALVESASDPDPSWRPWPSILRQPLATRILIFSMLYLYCFQTWAPNASTISLSWLPDFRWGYLRGLLWLLPLLALNFSVRLAHPRHGPQRGHSKPDAVRKDLSQGSQKHV